nr:MAG TPA: hypothetical protein [Caudoviricetes sp.]
MLYLHPKLHPVFGLSKHIQIYLDVLLYIKIICKCGRYLLRCIYVNFIFESLHLHNKPDNWLIIRFICIETFGFTSAFVILVLIFSCIRYLRCPTLRISVLVPL